MIFNKEILKVGKKYKFNFSSGRIRTGFFDSIQKNIIIIKKIQKLSDSDKPITRFINFDNVDDFKEID